MALAWLTLPNPFLHICLVPWPVETFPQLFQGLVDSKVSTFAVYLVQDSVL